MVVVFVVQPETGLICQLDFLGLVANSALRAVPAASLSPAAAASRKRSASPSPDSGGDGGSSKERCILID
jgi:hypothetical protein